MQDVQPLFLLQIYTCPQHELFYLHPQPPQIILVKLTFSIYYDYVKCYFLHNFVFPGVNNCLFKFA